MSESELIEDPYEITATYFPNEGGIVWRGEAYLPADYVLNAECAHEACEIDSVGNPTRCADCGDRLSVPPDREPVRQIQECSVCGERVPMSHATDEWEKRHHHADREPSDAALEALIQRIKGAWSLDTNRTGATVTTPLRNALNDLCTLLDSEEPSDVHSSSVSTSERAVTVSDAEVLAALNARELSVRERNGFPQHFTPAPSLEWYDDGSVADTRAALLAAQEVRR